MSTNKLLDIIVIGELNIDLVLRKVPLPQYEKEFLAEDMEFTMGSSSAITAFNLSAIGKKVAFLGKIGDDFFGNFMVQELNIGGVDTSHILVDKNLKTGATIVVANPPQKALLTYSGAMTELRLGDLKWDFIKNARHVHLGCFFLQTGLRKDVGQIFSTAKKFGLSTSMDTNWDPDDKWGEDLMEALKFTDIFLPNKEEALRITKSSNPEDAVVRLSELVEVSVVKLGKEGSILCKDRNVIREPTFPVEEIETTGAGDSFNAGFLSQYLEGKDWRTCLRYGNACGAIAVTEMGGTTAFRNPSNLRIKLSQILGK